MWTFRADEPSSKSHLSEEQKNKYQKRDIEAKKRGVPGRWIEGGMVFDLDHRTAIQDRSDHRSFRRLTMNQGHDICTQANFLPARVHGRAKTKARHMILIIISGIPTITCRP